jgi:hypothetical protein
LCIACQEFQKINVKFIYKFKFDSDSEINKNKIYSSITIINKNYIVII